MPRSVLFQAIIFFYRSWKMHCDQLPPSCTCQDWIPGGMQCLRQLRLPFSLAFPPCQAPVQSYYWQLPNVRTLNCLMIWRESSVTQNWKHSWLLPLLGSRGNISSTMSCWTSRSLLLHHYQEIQVRCGFILSWYYIEQLKLKHPDILALVSKMPLLFKIF